MSADLDLVFRLADEADRVSMSEYRSAALTKVTKIDGTPVAEVDRGVEEAMLAIVGAEHPDDAVVGEEVGERAGTSGRRWIFDGIDGTHNYAEGWPGWGTIIALEVDGEVEIGMVSAPAFGRRWWAVRGGGAFTAPYEPGAFDRTIAEPMRCSDRTELDGARVLVIPWEGFLLGWRDEVPKRFRPPEWPRSECFAIDGARAAQGDVDVTIIVFGGPWDVAATSLMMREAGGRFTDAWGGDRFDTWSGVFANAELSERVHEILGAPSRRGRPAADGDQPARPDRVRRVPAGRGHLARVRRPSDAVDVGPGACRQRAADRAQHRRRA
jgi:histidinol-phosphatase